MWGKGDSMEIRKAAACVFANTRFDSNSEFSDLYGHYDEFQAMVKLGGEEWAKYYAPFRGKLLSYHQADGSWKAPGRGWQIRGVATEYPTNPVYRTCLCALLLEIDCCSPSNSNSSDRSGV